MIHLTRMTRRFFWLILLLIGALTGTPVQSQTPRPRLRVLTYNIHHGEGRDGKFDYQRLAKVITNLQPDLVALQEVDNKTHRADGTDQASRLGELTGMYHVFGMGCTTPAVSTAKPSSRVFL